MSLFCRHNRFTADCPICSKGTVLESGSGRRRAAAPRRPAAPKAAGSSAFSGPHVATPARTGPDGALVVVRLERVLGGVRLAEWAGSALARRAPVLSGSELVDLVTRSGEALPAGDAERLVSALGNPRDPAADGTAAGVSRGRAGDFREELRIEPLDEGRLRVARWVLRPGSGWECQDAAPMLPAARYGEAIADAARHGLLVGPPASGAAAAERPTQA